MRGGQPGRVQVPPGGLSDGRAREPHPIAGGGRAWSRVRQTRDSNPGYLLPTVLGAWYLPSLSQEDPLRGLPRRGEAAYVKALGT